MQREGALYLFGLIADDKQNFLINLQERLAARVIAAGQIEFMGYRAFCNDVRVEEEPKRFVDGELVERFLDQGLDVQEACVKGLLLNDEQVTVEQAKVIIDHLRRLH
jgi:DNA damage-binding protein 1